MLEDYFVNDLFYDDTKVIFVLESPHIQEIRMGYPVAGKSGIDMSLVLFNINESFGKLVLERKIKNIGIINVSNYPLQKSAYRDQNAKVLEFFEVIRQNPKPRKSVRGGINIVISKMLENFKSRLEPHRDKKIVLCGNFAQNAFDVIFKESDFDGVLRVPHPSFNNWKKVRYNSQIERLKEFVK